MDPIKSGAHSPGEIDYGLQSTFLSGLDADQKLKIFDLAIRASRTLHRWATRFPLIRRVRVWPVSLAAAAATPFSSSAALVTTARMSLWIFTIDDLFDKEMVPFVELRRRVDRYQEILAGGKAHPEQERDTLGLALQEIRDDLQQYPLFAQLEGEWANAVSRTLDAMMQEHEWHMINPGQIDYAQLPQIETYLEYGRYTMGGPPHIWTNVITINDHSILQSLEHVKEMERTASTCIRLANDLQTYHHDAVEHKVSSMVIRFAEARAAGLLPQPALEQARAKVRQDILWGLQRCQILQEQGQTVSGNPERAIADLARFVCDFYVHHDFHTFPTATGR